jgi:hypothetical protein
MTSSNSIASLRDTLSGIVDMLDSVQVAAELIGQQSFCAVVVPEDAPAYVLVEKDPSLLATELRERLKTTTQLFVFQGSRCPVSKAPHPYLITSIGKHPLFEVEEVAESEDGYLYAGAEPAPAVIEDSDEDEVDEQVGESD